MPIVPQIKLDPSLPWWVGAIFVAIYFAMALMFLLAALGFRRRAKDFFSRRRK